MNTIHFPKIRALHKRCLELETKLIRRQHPVGSRIRPEWPASSRYLLVVQNLTTRYQEMMNNPYIDNEIVDMEVQNFEWLKAKIEDREEVSLKKLPPYLDQT